MFAVIVNTVAIIIGTTVGLLFRRGIPKGISDIVMQALGLCTVIIGAQGAVAEQNILVMIVACVVGAAIGEAMDWDGHINRFAQRLTARWAGKGEAGEGEGAKIANAFVTSCLIMNVGAMVIVGSLNAGLAADFTMLYTKSLLDMVSGAIMGAAMGIGVMGSAVFTLLFQGGIVLGAEWLAPFLSERMIAEISCTGCLLILAIGLNMIGLTKIKVLNYLPALAVVPVVLSIMNCIG